MNKLVKLVATLSVVAFSGCSLFNNEKDDENLKVLMIGNSFSICLLPHLPQVAADRNVKLDLASLYIGGCSLEKHWSNVEKDADKTFKPYRFGRNVCGKFTDGKANVCDVLRMAKWDIVTIQQASHFSWQPESYHPYGDKLVAKIKELAPQAKIVVQETWSYTPWDKRFAKWGIDQNEMYAKLHDAYAKFAAQYGLEVIPFGTAVQEWRKRKPVKYTEKSFGGDVVGGGKQEERDHFVRTHEGKWVPNCDVFHLGRRGEYFQALVWAKKLLGINPIEVGYKPEYVTDEDAKLMKVIASEVK